MRPLLLCLPFALLLSPGGRDATPPPPYRILVTNDDGITSPGLAKLVTELANFAEVTVCAPAAKCSGVSHSYTVYKSPLKISDTKIEGARRAVAVQGMPADAVCLGVVGLGRETKFDLVVSGINEGANPGKVAHYSGTIGAAMEAVYRGVPAVAVSLEPKGDVALAARVTSDFIHELRRRKLPADCVWSINVPIGATGHVVFAPMGGSTLNVTKFKKVAGDEKSTTWRGLRGPVDEGPRGCDTKAFLGRKVTVTPLRLDWTHEKALKAVRRWRIRVK